MPSHPLPAFDAERFRREGRAIVDWIACLRSTYFEMLAKPQ